MRIKNPIIIFNIFLLLLIAIGIWLIYFLLKIKIGYLAIISISVVVIILFFIFYTINFGIPMSDKTSKKIEEKKKEISLYRKNNYN